MTIELTGSYNSSTRNGTVEAHVTNITSGSLNGVLHIMIVETNIPYSWEGESMLYNVVRDMLPYAGTFKTLAAGASTDITQSFAIDSSWDVSNCSIISFFQQSSTSVEVCQGVKKSVLTITKEENPDIKNQSVLLKISENPVYKKADISYSLPDYTNVKLTVYDISGKAVRILVNKIQSAGDYKVIFDSNEFSSGIYFAELQAGNQRETRKFLLVK